MKIRPLSGAAFLGAMLLAAAVLTGCRSDAWYEERAVARAREFLLENSPELSAEQRAYVRYNLPLLLCEGVFGGEGPAVSDLSQICVTWVIPGQQDAYLVFGVSDYRMQSWYPNRLIRKSFARENRAWLQAVKAAREYVQNGLYYQISSHDYNCVRFEYPRVFRSRFELPLAQEGKASPAELAARKKQPQFALVWAPRDAENKVVVYGLSQPDLRGFTVYGGGLMSPGFLQERTLSEVSLPGMPGAAAEKKEQVVQ